MTLAAGQTLTHFQILGPLGAGGMGEVYRARDTRLEREVAIKVLPEELADDEERLRRFEREARTLASLNHANLAHVYGIDQVGDACFIAMELVEGEDLAQRLARGPLPVDEAIDVCRQIAEGLEAAHEAGVVHRDLKPANVRITPGGVVKILDFGLAKPIHGKTSDEGTTTAESDSFLMTEEGVVLGTPTYMSPEQARGKPVDRRTDIWAFGCVLYECLTGRRAFAGESLTDTLAAIVEHEPDWSALPAATPAHVRALLGRCLVKDQRLRLRDIGDGRLELSGAFAGVAGGGAPGAGAPASRGTRWVPWALAGALAVALAFALRPRTGAGTGAPRRSPGFTARTFGRQVIFNARFLPDGQSIVYGAAPAGTRPRLYLLHPDSLAPREIGPEGTLLLSASSTGQLAVLTDTTYIEHRVHVGTLARMTIDGAPRELVEDVRDADWGPDGELAIIHKVGGLDRLEYPIGNVLVETAGYMSEPRVSRDGATVAYLDHPASYDDRGWVKVVDRSGQVRTLSEEYWSIEGLAWTPDGKRLLYSGMSGADNSETLSVGIDGGGARRELATPGVVLVVDAAPDGRLLVLQLIHNEGIAARVPGRSQDLDLSWLDNCWAPHLSPDGETVAFTNGHGGKNYSVVVRRLDGSPIQTLGDGSACGISPDGRWALARLSSPPGVVAYPMGAGSARRLERGPLDQVEGARWFPDSEHVLVIGSEPGQPLRGYRQSIDGGPPERVTPEGLRGSIGSPSPRGDRLLSLVDGEGWLLVPLPDLGSAPDDGAALEPAPGLRLDDDVAGWSPDGTAVYVARRGHVPAELERVDLATGERQPSITVGPADQVGLLQVAFDDPLLDPAGTVCYDYQRGLSNLFVVDGVQ